MLFRSIKGKKINQNSKINKINNIGIILYFSLEEFSLDKKAIFNGDNIKLTDISYQLKEMRLGEEIEKFDIEITEGKEGIKYSQYQKYRKGYQYNWRVKQFVVESLKYHQEKYAKVNSTYSYIPSELKTSSRSYHSDFLVLHAAQFTGVSRAATGTV